MTLFPFGALLRLIRLARHGSRRALSSLLAFVLGLGLIIASAIIGSTVGTVVGAVLFAVGYAGSRPGFSWL
jgi:integral membrane sensor domain MASE1